ncbi:hypothetical protein Hanom_Chr16g01502311 [Helianthus anomalus]
MSPQLHFWRVLQQQHQHLYSGKHYGVVCCLRFLQWRVNGDHAEEVVSGFRSHQKESLFPDLNEVVVPSGDYGYGFTDYEYDYGVASGQENYGNNLSLVMPRTYNKTFVSIHTSKIHCVASNSLPG